MEVTHQKALPVAMDHSLSQLHIEHLLCTKLTMIDKGHTIAKNKCTNKGKAAMVSTPPRDHSLVERKAFNKQEQSPGSRVILGGVQSAVGEHGAGRPKNIGGPGKSSRESSSN